MTQSLSFLPQFNRQVWVQAIGRGLYQVGHGLLQFYVPIIFVNQVGLSATAVGIGLASASIAAVMSHFLGGALADSLFGRRKTQLLAAGFSTIAALVLAVTHTLPLLIVANLLVGLSAGMYWTAADAAVMDVTLPEERHQAFAVLGFADSVGMGIGILSGGMLLTLLDQGQQLFWIGSLVFLAFLVLLQLTVVETRQSPAELSEQSSEPPSKQPPKPQSELWRGWLTALQDKALWIFILVNSLFTTYIALVHSTLPLYFTHLSSVEAGAIAASPENIGNLFTWGYIGLGAVFQIPIVRALGALGWMRALMLSMSLWGLGFFLVWTLGTVISTGLTHETGVLMVLAIATVIYKPFASAFLAELAPEALRGAYTAIGYQCWAIGYFIGPMLGGWALDQPQPITHHTWLAVALSTCGGLLILWFLSQYRGSEQPALEAGDRVTSL